MYELVNPVMIFWTEGLPPMKCLKCRFIPHSPNGLRLHSQGFKLRIKRSDPCRNSSKREEVKRQLNCRLSQRYTGFRSVTSLDLSMFLTVNVDKSVIEKKEFLMV